MSLLAQEGLTAVSPCANLLIDDWEKQKKRKDKKKKKKRKEKGRSSTNIAKACISRGIPHKRYKSTRTNIL